MARIIALANQKGGTGKTTTTLNLGTVLAERGHRVLLVDMDPQSNLTMGLGVNPYEEGLTTTYEVLLNADRGVEIATLNVQERLDLVPATLDMAAAERELRERLARETILKRALRQARDTYDYILLDPPPSLGFFTLNALVAATEVIIPIQVHPYALKGMSQLQKTVELVQAEVNPGLVICGVVITQVQRNNLAATLEQKLRASPLGKRVYQTTIPMNVRLTESTASGKPVILYDRECAGAQAYIALGEEVDHGET
jgi:chromosome partitioning protein